METKLNNYNQKRNFKNTKEPKGKIKQVNNKSNLKFFVQHHMARKDHFDFRLEWKGVLLSFAIPKGFSYNSKDKRLAIQVENHPLDYGTFEGTIPKGEYGGGTVMLWDMGTYIPYEKNVGKSIENGSLKFELFGKRLMGKWALIKIKNDDKNNWIIIKEKDEFENKIDTAIYNKSIKTNLTMKQIENGEKKAKAITNVKLLKDIEKIDFDKEQTYIGNIKISNPQKVMLDNVKKIDIIKYYITVSKRMLPYLKNRIVSIVRCPDGQKGSCFFKKHPNGDSEGITHFLVENSKREKEEYFYIENVFGLIFEAQMNTIEFHTWASKVENLEKPDYMVFDLDPDEKLGLGEVRQGVKDLKTILDKLSLISFLKTSGGKGYHIVVPFIPSASWENFYLFAKNIAKLMEQTFPNRYTSNMRKINRKGKIFIDAERNTRSATSVAPYSIRARKNAPVSMPILWSKLNKIAPNDINIEKALKRIKKADPWKIFLTLNNS